MEQYTSTYHPGDVIQTYNTGNKFKVEKSPLQGGMGCVYIARREKDGRLYALKTLLNHKNQLLDSEKIERFKWESLIWIILGKHPNIVQAFWFDFSQHYEPFLIMEYIENSGSDITLDKWIEKRKKSKKRFKEQSEILKIMIHALNGLIFARNTIKNELNKEFIHRDLKPQNIFITRNIQVSDFGLAKAFSKLDHIAGTISYMPPEQWEGNEVVEKSDIYALGCILYEMITGKILFDFPKFAYNKPEIIRMVRNKHFNARPSLPIFLHSGIKDLIMTCLEKDFRNRYSFDELFAELQLQYRKLAGTEVLVQSEMSELTAEEWNSRGTGFDQLGEYTKAISCYNNALARNDKDTDFYLNRGNSFLRQNSINEAIHDFKRAIDIDSNSLRSCIGIAGAFCLKGDFQTALDYYEKAKQINENEERIYLGIGIVFAKQSNTDDAILEFEKALKIKPDCADAYFYLGNVYNEKAYENYKKALVHRKGNYPKAKEMMDKLFR